MPSDDKFLELLNQLTHAHKVQTDAAYERGRAAGRREARAELRDEMKALRYLFEEDTVAASAEDEEDLEPKPEAEEAEDVVDAGPDQGRRAPPGSVKPIISDLIHNRPGLTTVEIRAITKLKPNSIRGTLWMLSAQDKTIERREGRWYPVAHEEEAAGANPPERTPTASDEEDPARDLLGPSTPDRGPQAAERQVIHEKIDP